MLQPTEALRRRESLGRLPLVITWSLSALRATPPSRHHNITPPPIHQAHSYRPCCAGTGGALLQGRVCAALCATPSSAGSFCPTPRLSTLCATWQAIPLDARAAPCGHALRPRAPSPARNVRIPPVTASQKFVCPASSLHTRIARAPTYPRLPTCVCCSAPRLLSVLGSSILPHPHN